MIQIVDMAAFVTVVQVASFTDAARRLDTTKSVVSRRITDLERELGVPLLDRSARGVRPTEVGAVYYAKCVRILESIHAASDFVAGFNSLVKGRLSVVVPSSFGDSVIVPLLNRFADVFPDVMLDVVVGGDDSLGDMQFDVAIHAGRVEEPDLVAREISSYRYVLCAAPQYLHRQGVPATPGDLALHDALVEGGGALRDSWALMVDGKWHDFPVRERLRSQSCGQLVAAARAGLGIVMLPEPIVADDLRAGRLQIVLPDCRTPQGRLSVVYPKSRRGSQKVQKLLNFLMESLAAESVRQDEGDGSAASVREMRTPCSRSTTSATSVADRSSPSRTASVKSGARDAGD